MGMVETVGLVLHPRRDSKVAIDTIVEWARDRGVTVYGLPDEIGRIDCSAVAVDTATLVERADLLVSLGGDGTMLRTMRLIAGRPTPILGVNLGKLGFLAEIDVDDLPSALSFIDNHEYTVEPRMAVRATLPGDTSVTAFNDIALVRIPGDGLSAVAISVEGHPFVRYAADAVIVATPTGSTAYSFSAGGPIVSPTVEGFLVVPAAAHSAFNRALMLSADEQVSLEVLPTSGRLAVEVDGAIGAHLCPGDQLTVTAIRALAWVVRLGSTSFYERARRKLRVNDSAEIG
ncbi:NAD(+)/NADH kinase [Streptosporangium sp. NBC_01756]|uniref:NAD(+)/NADH kinase n=1 Tax=Streptosporangium sp. NBC_01756 TaxID=2975950 RepID=UPI002DDA198D|nr:NAD(+)/NADH kinase [Streptosporangium sp. NBC_01756]WSC87973.1 NAD(+)/NADH kinase [Streptosporangium sp. NBC_01756]